MTVELAGAPSCAALRRRGARRLTSAMVRLTQLSPQPLLAAIALFCFNVGDAGAWDSRQLDVNFHSMGDYGNVGLLQTPSARMAPDGQVSIGLSRVWPYERYTVTMQAMPWLETTLRYTNVLNRLYGPADFSGDQSYKDRSIDVKLRLLRESAATPELSVGIRDIAGTGLFSAEYLVANRRFYNFDFMFGIGWGLLGKREQIKNPLSRLSSRFSNRQLNVGEGGKLSTTSFFRGEQAALLAGVSYRTTVPGLTLKAELDGDDYQNAPQGNNQNVSSAINLGAAYRINNWLDASIALERGNRVMFQLVFKDNLKSSNGLPKYDPPPPRIRPRRHTPTSKETSPLRQADLAHIEAQLASADFLVQEISSDDSGRRLSVSLAQHRWRNHARAAGRAGRIIANSAPPSVEIITVANLENGLETHRISLLRSQLENTADGLAAPEDMWRSYQHLLPANKPEQAPAAITRVNPQRYPHFRWRWKPGLRQHIGGPDNPYFYQILLNLAGELQLARGLDIEAVLAMNVHNNFDGLRLESDSQLPHVRSDIKHYLKQGANGLSRLQLNYQRRIADDWYSKLSAGLLEEMFAGVGGEVILRPHARRWSIGGQLYRVRQRDYDKLFSLRDYGVTTGHIEFASSLPFYNIHGKLSFGKYLAGDRGFTIETARQFNNGSRTGIWLTRTNVSAEQFGEGSFDKGLFISIPLDRLTLFSSRGDVNFIWRPLTRDGGQKLSPGSPLHGMLDGSSRHQLAVQWSSLLD